MIVAPFLTAALFLPVQDAAAPPVAPPTTDEAPDEAVTGQVIDAGEVVDYDAIEDRLRTVFERLEEVGWVADPAVRAEDGIVTLRGIADTEDHRARIGEIARTVRGVTVVLNDLEVPPPDPLDLARVTRSLRAVLGDLLTAVPYLLFALVILGLTWLSARVVSRLARWWFGPRIENPLLETVAVRAAGVAVWVLGAYVVLLVCGLTGLALTVLGGAGLGGLVVGFAFRNIAENFLASVLLSVNQPFRPGDVVEIDGHLGLVRKVTTRGTLLMSLDGNHVQIPNATVYSAVILNRTANPNLRQDFTLGLDYGDTLTDAQAAIFAVLREHPAVLDDPEPWVLVDALGAGSVNLKVYFWVDGHAHNALKVRSSVIRLVKRGVEAAGFTMPDEAREVIFPQGVPLIGADGDDGTSTEPPAKPAPVGSDVVATPSEGNLSSEVKELSAQADRSADPDDAPDLLTPTLN